MKVKNITLPLLLLVHLMISNGLSASPICYKDTQSQKTTITGDPCVFEDRLCNNVTVEDIDTTCSAAESPNGLDECILKQSPYHTSSKLSHCRDNGFLFFHNLQCVFDVTYEDTIGTVTKVIAKGKPCFE